MWLAPVFEPWPDRLTARPFLETKGFLSRLCFIRKLKGKVETGWPRGFSVNKNTGNRSTQKGCINAVWICREKATDVLYSTILKKADIELLTEAVSEAEVFDFLCFNCRGEKRVNSFWDYGRSWSMQQGWCLGLQDQGSVIMCEFVKRCQFSYL